LQDTSLLGVYDHIYEDNFNATPNINTHYAALCYQFVVPMTVSIKIDSQHANIK